MSQETRAEANDTWKQVRRFVLVTTSFILLLVLMGYRLRNQSREPRTRHIDHAREAEPGYDSRCGSGLLSPHLQVITSPEKVDWVVRGGERFTDLCPNIRVHVVERPDFEAITEMETGVTPDLWLPSDELFADYLDEAWAVEGRPPLEHEPSLLHMPIVLVMWSDRLRALEALWPRAETSEELVAELSCPGLVRGPLSTVEPADRHSWPAWFDSRMMLAAEEDYDLDMVASWGDVEVLHTYPTRQTTGALVLLAMVHGYFAAQGYFPVDDDVYEIEIDEHEVDLGEWLERCDKHALEQFTGSSRTLAQRVFQRGPSVLDGAFVYEQAALEILAAEPRLEIIYPRELMISNHPAVVFPGQDNEVAHRFVDFLRAKEMQVEAIRFGMRPSSPIPNPERPGGLSIALRDAPLPGSDNPFLALRVRGVELRLDAQHDPPRPPRDTMRRIIEMWADATGRY